MGNLLEIPFARQAEIAEHAGGLDRIDNDLHGLNHGLSCYPVEHSDADLHGFLMPIRYDGPRKTHGNSFLII
jgi:hypothetical protein